MGSMQCNVEFGYQLSICSGTKENLDRVGRSQDLPDANRLLASSPALNPRALALVPICAAALLFKRLQVLVYKHFYVHMICNAWEKQCIPRCTNMCIENIDLNLYLRMFEYR
jgi:hypothetical protein